MREYKKVYNYEQYKKHSRVMKGKLKSRTGGLKVKDPEQVTTDPLRYYRAIPINRKSITVQPLRSEHAGPGESETP